jgi:hypothetical protein
MNAQALIAYLEGPRGLTLEQLNTLTDEELKQLSALLHHWRELTELRLDWRREAKQHAAAETDCITAIAGLVAGITPAARGSSSEAHTLLPS